MELGGSAVDLAAYEVRIALLELARTEHAPSYDSTREPRGVPLDLCLHVVGEPLAVVVVPCASHGPFAGIAATRWGMCVYAHIDSVPEGERVGSAVVI